MLTLGGAVVRVNAGDRPAGEGGLGDRPGRAASLDEPAGERADRSGGPARARGGAAGDVAGAADDADAPTAHR